MSSSDVPGTVGSDLLYMCFTSLIWTTTGAMDISRGTEIRVPRLTKYGYLGTRKILDSLSVILKVMVQQRRHLSPSPFEFGVDSAVCNGQPADDHTVESHDD